MAFAYYAFRSRAKARNQKQIVAQESVGEIFIAIRLEATEDECKQHVHKNNWERNITPPELKQAAEARVQRLMVEERTNHIWPALASTKH